MTPRPNWCTDDERSGAQGYNQRQLDRGVLTVAHMTELVAEWQWHRDGLRDDGKFGPVTRQSVQDAAGWDPLIGDVPQPGADPEVAVERSVGLSALWYAISQIGLGEIGRNNAGENIVRWGGREGAPWCATFVSACLERGARDVGERFHGRSAHAKTLFKFIRRNGVYIGRDPTLILPGDVVAWHRGKGRLLERGQGHIGIAERWDGELLHTIEGNIGGFESSRGARVRRFTHDVELEGRRGPPARASGRCS